MELRRKSAIALTGFALLGAAPVMGIGLGHGLFMRGSIVDMDATGSVVCVGKSDGAAVGQVLSVYRIVTLPGPPRGSAPPQYRRESAGHVKVDRIFDDHFAHVSTVDGAPKLNDIVELRRVPKK